MLKEIYNFLEINKNVHYFNEEIHGLDENLLFFLLFIMISNILDNLLKY